MGMGGGPTGADGFTHQWQYKSTIDPEELFRKIFGDAGFKSEAFSDFAESKFGFGAAQEVKYQLLFIWLYSANAVMLNEIVLLMVLWLPYYLYLIRSNMFMTLTFVVMSNKFLDLSLA